MNDAECNEFFRYPRVGSEVCSTLMISCKQTGTERDKEHLRGIVRYKIKHNERSYWDLKEIGQKHAEII